MYIYKIRIDTKVSGLHKYVIFCHFQNRQKIIFCFFLKYFANIKIHLHLYPQSDKIARALSSVGSEHLVYTQRVGGSNPSAPTKGSQKRLGFLFYVLNFPGATVIFPDNPKGG